MRLTINWLFKAHTHYTSHVPSQRSQAEPRTSSCSVWACSSRATSRAIRLVARLVLICHFQIFGVACCSARVVCGGKIALAEPAVTLVYRVNCLSWHEELRKTSYFNTEYSYSAIVSQNFVQHCLSSQI